MLRRVDDYLLDRAQDTCHFIQRLTGITNFTIARAALVVSTTGSAWTHMSSGSWAGLLLTAIAFLAFWASIAEAERACHYDGESQTMNPFRGKLIWFVLRWLEASSVFCGVAMSDWHTVYPLLRWAMVTTMVLTPLPPGQSKISEWISSIAPRKLAPV